jgi:signal peptidase I
VFLLGDNRANSVDSRVYGAVPFDEVVGRAVLRVWPLG